MINIIDDTINKKDIDNLIEWLKTYPRLTKGIQTTKFEEQWASYIGTKYATFVNSGSSANLLMLMTLLETKKIQKNDVIIVPAVSWATDLAPVIQLGLIPMLCDCDLKNLSIDVEYFEQLAKKYTPKALLLVSVLGLVPDINVIKNICDKYNIIILEDVCEGLGSKYNGRKLGTFGLMSSFSTYFGHHMSTIEGGLVCTNDEQCNNVLKSIRSHGWGRELPENEKQRLDNCFNISKFDTSFTFYYTGFNLRSTDLQAFIGLNQLKKLPDIVKKREKNFNLYQFHLLNSWWKPQVKINDFISNFAYPVIHEKRNKIVEILEQNKIDTRPLICGSMEFQPFYRKLYGDKIYCRNAEIVHKRGLYVPNHPSLTEENIIFICKLINEVING